MSTSPTGPVEVSSSLPLPPPPVKSRKTSQVLVTEPVKVAEVAAWVWGGVVRWVDRQRLCKVLA